MSTLSDRKPSPPGADATSANPAPDGMVLAQAMGQFLGGFERFTRSLIGPDAPSYPRMRLLYELHCDGPQRMGDLASALDVTPRSVTALVDGLEGEGLVRRQPHPTDRRATMIELTDSARDAVDRSMEHHVAIGQLFGTLSPADRATLLRLTHQLEAGMRPAGASGVPGRPDPVEPLRGDDRG